MQVGEKKVVTIEYTLKNDAGETVDSSEGRQNLAYIHGVGQLVPGLEKALAGKSAGEEVKVTVSPEEGYGKRDESLVRNMPVRRLPDAKARPGMRYRVETPEGPRFVTVKSVKGDYAMVDINHPLAGMNLHFEVKITDVREATKEELEHGHVHGPGGHDH